MPVQTRMQVRRDTAANWTSTNPTRGAGELGFETDTTLMKIGNGSTAWTSLPYEFTPAYSASMPWSFIAGRYYDGANGQAISTLGAVDGRLYITPFFVPRTTTFDQIGINVTATAASSVIRLGIYNMTTGQDPTSLVLDAGTVDSATSTGIKTITISQQLTAGLYALASCAQGGAPSVGSFGGHSPWVSRTTFGTYTGWLRTIGTVALPTPASPDNATSNLPRVFLRAA